MTNIKWHQKTWLLTLMCIFIPYVGIFFVWSKIKSSPARTFLTVWAIVALIATISEDKLPHFEITSDIESANILKSSTE